MHLWFVTHELANTFKKFLLKLQDHLLGQLHGREFDGDMHEEFTDSDHNSVHIIGSKIYSVQRWCVYYTSYDLQWQYDTVSPCTHPDIMLHSPINKDNAEPYWYARGLGVYHANIWFENSVIPGAKNPRCMDFLWVCWLGEEPGYLSGFCRACLPKIGFVPSTDEFSFSFVDPAHVVHRCHLIPAFNAGQSADLLLWPCSIARRLDDGDEDDKDWLNFYVNMWVDLIFPSF